MIVKKKNEAFTFGTVLIDTADTTKAKVNPTIAAGDFQISKDGGSFTNLTNLPSVLPAADDQVVIVLTAAEMNADHLMVRAQDVAGAEWDEQRIEIVTEATSNADLATDIATVDTVVDTIAVDVAGLDGDAMRGTDSAALASDLTTHDGKLDTVDGIVDAILIDTTGLNGDAMRGTDSAALASALVTHDGKLDTVDTVVDGIVVDVAAVKADTLEGLGLSLKNVFQHTMTFDSNGNLLTGTLDVYDTKANAETHDGATGLLTSYLLTATYSGENLDTFLHRTET